MTIWLQHAESGANGRHQAVLDFIRATQASEPAFDFEPLCTSLLQLLVADLAHRREALLRDLHERARVFKEQAEEEAHVSVATSPDAAQVNASSASQPSPATAAAWSHLLAEVDKLAELQPVRALKLLTLFCLGAQLNVSYPPEILGDCMARMTQLIEGAVKDSQQVLDWTVHCWLHWPNRHWQKERRRILLPMLWRLLAEAESQPALAYRHYQALTREGAISVIPEREVVDLMLELGRLLAHLDRGVRLNALNDLFSARLGTEAPDRSADVRRAAQREVFELARDAVELDERIRINALHTLLLRGDPGHPNYQEVCERLWAWECTQALELSERWRLCGTLAINAPVGSEPQRGALNRLRDLANGFQSIECTDSSADLRVLLGCDLEAPGVRHRIKGVSRNWRVGAQVEALLNILALAEDPDWAGILRNPDRPLSCALDALVVAEQAFWSMVDWLADKGPGLPFEALILATTHIEEPGRGRDPFTYPTERLQVFGDLVKARLVSGLGVLARRDCSTCAALLLRLICDSHGFPQYRRRVYSLLDAIYPMLAGQDPELAAWIIKAGASVEDNGITSVWRGPGRLKSAS